MNCTSLLSQPHLTPPPLPLGPPSPGSFGDAGRDVPPKLTPRAPPAFPGVSIDQSKIVGDARVQTEVVRIARRDGDVLDRAARGVEVHLDMVGPGRVRGPEQVGADPSGHGGVAAGVDDGDDGAAARDEVAPYLLEGVDEVGRRCGGVDGKVGGQVGAVVGGGDGVLVFPALFAGSGEGFCEPVAWTGVCDLVVEVEGALFLAGGELGLVHCRGPAVAEGVEKWFGKVGVCVFELVDLQEAGVIGSSEGGECGSNIVEEVVRGENCWRQRKAFICIVLKRSFSR